MGKIFKNMLPYWKWILVIVAFLVMQAFCDLSLPQYTSDIIDGQSREEEEWNILKTQK